jgi:hypothetical protein
MFGYAGCSLWGPGDLSCRLKAGHVGPRIEILHFYPKNSVFFDCKIFGFGHPITGLVPEFVDPFLGLFSRKLGL